MTKNEQIANTFKETMLRRQTQICKVFEFKVKKHMLNKLQQEQIKMIFVEAKWLYNYLLSLTNEDSIDIFKVGIKDIDKITHYNKDKELVESDLNYLKSSMKDSVIKDICNSIKGLSVLKKHNKKIGALKFKSDYNSLKLKQYGITHKIVSKNRIKIQGIKKPLCVSGLKQLDKLDSYEIANAHLIQRNGDYYVQLTILINPTKQEKHYKREQLGIDFGCETSFSLSTGEKFNAYIEETDHLKRLQRKLEGQKKGSNNRRKTILKIQKQYERLNNLKDEYARQLVHKLLEENKQIIIQDEQLNLWKRKHGKKVQHSVLGRVKTRLLMHPNQVVVLNKFVPTTKLCRDCGYIHSEIKLWNREFICPECGVKYDRDIHAAENMVWIYNNLLGVDGTKFKHEDFEFQLNAIFRRQGLQKLE